MPIFKNPQGQTVTSQEALIDGARLRPGYYQVLAEGDRIGFDISMLDSKATPGSTFLTDGTSPADRSRMLAAGRYQQATSDASASSRASHAGTVSDASPALRAENARAVVDTLRTARYS
jgi:hypothetical protein